MKKIFTLLTLAATAVAVNAQTESWSIQENGELKAIFVANEDVNKASVVNFNTTNVDGTFVSGPLSHNQDNVEELVDGKYPFKYDNKWGAIQSKDVVSDGSVVKFYYVSGQGNPVNVDKIEIEKYDEDKFPNGYGFKVVWDNAYYAPDGSNGLPTNGSYVTLTPKVDGALKVAGWINKQNRPVYVAKKSDAKALQNGTEVKISGYINGMTYKIDSEDGHLVAEDSPLKGQMYFQEDIQPLGTEGTAAYAVSNQPVWVYLTFNAKANETYYIFVGNAQIGFGGYEFTPGADTAIESIIAPAADDDAPIYNILGQRVNADYKGLVIKNGKKYIQK